MQFLTLVIIIFLVLDKFELAQCFKIDRRLEEEIVDYANYLKHKQGSSKSHFDPLAALADAVSDIEVDSLEEYNGHGKKQKTRRFIKDLAHNKPKKKELKRNSKKSSPPKKLVASAKFSKPEEALIDTAPDEKHYGVEEIVYIRRSESDLNDPIPEMIEKLVHEKPPDNVHERTTDIDLYELPAGDDPNVLSPSAPECPVINPASHADQTCSDGPEYEIEFDPAFHETLKREMENMLPESRVEGSKCDPRRHLGPETLVEDRALCPYQVNISNHNPSRIPADLYEAECSCQVWRRPGDLSPLICTAVKRAVPVLWLVNCEDGRKRYKQGWDEVTVACVPDMVLGSDSINVGSVDN